MEESKGATQYSSNLMFGVFQFSHAGDKGGPGKRGRGSGGPQRGNRKAKLQPEPGPNQYEPHPKRPRLSRRGVRRYDRAAVSQHPPVAVAAADQCQLHKGTK